MKLDVKGLRLIGANSMGQPFGPSLLQSHRLGKVSRRVFLGDAEQGRAKKKGSSTPPLHPEHMIKHNQLSIALNRGWCDYSFVARCLSEGRQLGLRYPAPVQGKGGAIRPFWGLNAIGVRYMKNIT